MKLILVAMVAGVMLVGCGEGANNEPYIGAPKDGSACEQAYKLPANVEKCVQEESRH